MAAQGESGSEHSTDKRQVLVTGGNSGIGLAIAKRFVEGGDDVVAWGQNEERLAATAKIDGITAERVDVRDPHAVYEAMGRIASRGPLGVVVNSAAAAEPHSLKDAAYGDAINLWGEMRLANLDSAVYVGLAAIHHLLPGGRIVFMSSEIASDVRARLSGAYVTAKAGVEGLTRALADELGPSRITVNAVAPGFVPGTGMTEPLGPAVEEYFEARTRVGLSTKEEVEAMVHHLASPDASSITGQVFHVNGGAYFG